MTAPLPIDPYLPGIARSIREHGALVVIGPPGSGKTTRVPPAVLEGGLRAKGKVLVLEPRRIAARAAAVRIAAERSWTLGAEVGYTVRFENRTGPKTRLQVLTEGILTRMIRSDPFLEGVAAVILDEFHERSIHADLALALLREVRASGRDDLALAVLSATLDPDPVSRFLGNCPIVTVEGRPYPVGIEHVNRPGLSDLSAFAARTVRDAWNGSKGNVLVFLPGIREIRRTARELEGFAGKRDAIITPLHGGLRLKDQQHALDPSDRRKIVLATNVAETSITIDGVDLVIDGGYARVLRSDPRHGIDRLELSRISRYSADQRAGRAGRTGPGKAIRLWSLAEDAALPEREEPEVRRVDLASAVMELRAWGMNDPASFDWFEPPEPARLARAEALLESLGAIHGKGGPLTPLGKAMLEIPAHPRLARIVTAAHEMGILKEGAGLAALIEERDIIPLSASPAISGARARPRTTGPSDLLLRLDLLDEAEEQRFRRERPGEITIDIGAARMAARTRKVLVREARRVLVKEPRGRKRGPDARSVDTGDDLLRILLQGYPDRVVRRRGKGSDRGRMVGGRGVVLSPGSVVRDAELFIAIDLDEGARGERLEARVNLASAVRREWLEEDLPAWIEERVDTSFDPATERVRSTVSRCFLDLPLEEPRDRPPPVEEAQRILEDAARARAEEIFLSSRDVSRWLARVRSLTDWMPELELPRFDSQELADAIAGACAGKTSLKEIRDSDLLGLLKAQLPHPKLAAIKRHAPEAIVVPSGSRIRLTYEPGKPPVLAVRLQELFGLAETPAVAAGRVPVLLHILGPNYRPVQITQDLRSFWNTTYVQVRKDLRARYPKHSWPEDPWSARPESRPKRRR